MRKKLTKSGDGSARAKGRTAKLKAIVRKAHAKYGGVFRRLAEK